MVSSHAAKLTRRTVLRALAAGAGASLAGVLAGCVAAPTPQIVEKQVEVTREVEKEKVVTQVVEVLVTPTSAPRTGPVVVTYYSWIDAEGMAGFANWIAPFHEQHPDIFVQIIPAVGSDIESKQKLLAMMIAGTPPDTLFFIPADFIWSGIVQSLNPLIERDNYDVSGISKNILEGATWKGELYLIPMLAGGNNTMMCYNKTMFAEAGVEPPPTKWNDPAWSWEEWVARMAACVRDLDGDGKIDTWGLGSIGWRMSWSRMWNTSWINQEDMTTITCDTPEMIDCYTHVNNLRCADKVMPPYGTDLGPVDPFMGGRTAMSIMGWWTFAAFDACDVDWEFSPYPTPKGGNSKCEMVPDTGGAIVKGSKNVDAAWEFIKWMDNGNFHRFRHAPPARAAFVEDWGQFTFQKHPTVNYMMLLEALDNAGDQDKICYHPCWGEMFGKVVNPKWELAQKCELEIEQMLAECKVELQELSDTCQQKAF
ncbi:MAG: extracellular solute-binding protein [Anaerolineae bacterium]